MFTIPVGVIEKALAALGVDIHLKNNGNARAAGEPRTTRRLRGQEKKYAELRHKRMAQRGERTSQISQVRGSRGALEGL